MAHHMYYIAIVCPPDLQQKILRHKQWMKEHFGCVVAMRSPAHITLIPPFWLEDSREDILRETLKSFNTGTTDLVVSLDGFSHFGKRVLFAHVENTPRLEDIKKQVESHFVQYMGDIIKPEDHPFHPHITIANRDMKPSDFNKAWEHFSNTVFRERFSVNGISLLKLGLAQWDVIDKVK
jgi:2'-5' RNA ligase